MRLLLASIVATLLAGSASQAAEFNCEGADGVYIDGHFNDTQARTLGLPSRSTVLQDRCDLRTDCPG